MNSTQHTIPPFQGITNEELERFASVIAAKVLSIVDKGDETYTKSEAAAFLKYSDVKQIDKMKGLKPHRLTENGDPRYLKSQLIEFVKAS